MQTRQGSSRLLLAAAATALVATATAGCNVAATTTSAAKSKPTTVKTPKPVKTTTPAPLTSSQPTPSASTAPATPTATSTATAPSAPTLGSVALAGQGLPGRQVWAHIIPQGLPTWSEGSDGLNQYGELYPLDLVDGNYFTPGASLSEVPQAQAAGLTGVEILQYGENQGSDFVSDWMKQADPTWADTNADNNFSVAPCLGIGSSEDDAVRLVTQYAAAAAGHPSAARVNGKLVVYVYGSQDMSAAGWSRVRARLAAAGVGVFLVADLGADAAARPYTQRAAPIDALFPSFDASYTFDWTTPSVWKDLIGFLNSNNRQYAGGMMPGYDRETCDTCPYYDAQGTKVYRQQWEQNLTSGADWQTISTWNDMVERTELEPTSSWNTTRSDITAFYSAKFRGVAFPKPTAQLYVTTPDYIRIGDAPQAEGLILNGSSAAASVSTQLLDGNGQPIGAPATATVKPATTGDATTPAAATITSMPAGHFLRARATSYDADGNVLQTVTSAPILVYTATDAPTNQLRRLYYSIPAYDALPGTVTLALHGNPAAAPTTATATAPAGTAVRYNEVLQNTRQVTNGFADSSLTTAVPMGSRTIIGGQTISAAPNGFYVARVIDSKDRVGYSDPVYIP